MMETGVGHFDRFVVRKSGKLRWIVHKTVGEYELDDVISEAFLILIKFEAEDAAFCLDDPASEDKMLRYLSARLVKFTEKVVRKAVRLDHWAHGDDPESDAHPLLNKLTNEGADPLAVLIERQEHHERPDPPSHHSPAAAYGALLRKYRQSMAGVADHLLLSVSWTYNRYAKARLWAERQEPLPLGAPSRIEQEPRAWRTNRFERSAPMQLALDFDCLSI